MSTVAAELPGARVLDLFAGSGALGLEALSRGAARATFVEQDAKALASLRANLASLGAADRADVFRTDAVKFAQALTPGAYDVAFADPPYAKGFAAAIAQAFGAVPFAALLCIEHGKDDALIRARRPDNSQGLNRARRRRSTSSCSIPSPRAICSSATRMSSRTSARSTRRSYSVTSSRTAAPLPCCVSRLGR